jgi:hypothetical protein
VATYKVTFLGLTVAGPEEEARLLAGLQKKFNLTPERAERLFQKVPIVVKKGISKAEMERYIKAFEEIGGKVKAEEEPSSERLEITRELPEVGPRPEAVRPEPPPGREPPASPQPSLKFGPSVEKRTYTGKMVTCPQCGFEQPETDECIKCGIIISKFFQYQEMAKTYEGQVREISSEERPAPSWEKGEGFIESFINTTREALFSPTQFFKKVAEGRGYWAPLIYGVICGVIGSCVAVLWQWLFASQWIPVHLLSMIPFFSIFLIIFLIALPVMIAFSILVGSGITHLCLMIVGGNRKGFESTFRALSYAYGGNLFGVIPFLGSTIGGIYTLVLTIFGVREGHGISTGKAVLAVLLPLIVLIGLIVLLVLLLPLIIGSSLKFLGGARI